MATLLMQLVALMVAVGQATVCAQVLSEVPPNGHGVCRGRDIRDPKGMQALRNCSVIDGNLRILTDIRFGFNGQVLPYLREITGYLLIVYPKRVSSLGALFPRLQRIRGRHLFFDYALFVLEITDLEEIGLYDLTTVDRGGVFLWEFYNHLPCYATTIDWGVIAPEGRTVISQTRQGRCSCPGCGPCWNHNYPQRMLEGPLAERCDAACLGCAPAAPARCTRCRHYTDHGRCVPACPPDKVVLEGPQYCLTKKECLEIFDDAIIHENLCLTSCPDGMVKDSTQNICVSSPTEHKKICPSLRISYLENVHWAAGCTHINGSLEIKINGSINAQKELTSSLSTLEVIDHYLEINSTMFLSSLDFLPSLRRINGNVLKNNKYSLLIVNNLKLNKTFSDDVLNRLIVKAGTMFVNENPFLCHKEIDKLRPKFMVQADGSVDVVRSKNGNAGTCNVIVRNMNITVFNDTTSLITFVPTKTTGATYHLYYIHWSPNKEFDVSLGASGCWAKKPINSNVSVAKITLTNLTPSTYYIFFIEAITNDENVMYGRSSLFNFTTHIGTLSPPFITELTSGPDNFYITWLDHLQYSKSITHYFLEVTMNEVNEDIFEKKNGCKLSLDFSGYSSQEFRHKYFKEPTMDYILDCQVYCGGQADPLLNIKNDIFEICGPRGLNCAGEEPEPTKNLTVNGIKKHLLFKIPAGIKNYSVDGLQPYSDYRAKLRACVHAQCSRSSRQSIRTLIVEGIGAPAIEDAIAVDGVVSVKWSKPKITNGPVLAYTVEIKKSYLSNSTYANGLQQWCVNLLEFKENRGVYTARTEYTSEDILLRVCSISTGVNRVCSSWLAVAMRTKPVAWWVCLSLFGIAVLGFIIYVWKRRSKRSDRELLINEDSDTDDPSAPWSCGEPMRFSTLLRDET